MELELKKAQTTAQQQHGRLFGAQADAALAAIEKGKRWDALQQRVTAETLAEERADNAKRAQGLGGLVAGDRPAEGFSAPQPTVGAKLVGMADRLRLAGAAPEDWIQRLGAPPDKVAEMANKASLTVQHEAAAAHSQAQTAAVQLKQRAERAEQLGTLAAYALKGPVQFREALAAAAGAPQLAPYLSRIPQNLNSARPILERLVAEGMTLKEKAAAESADLSARARMASAGADQVRASASASLAKTREEFIRVRKDAFVKNEGYNTPGARERLEEMTEASKQRRQLQQLRQFPKAPLDDKLLKLGTVYTAQDGKTLVEYAGKDPATGKMLWKTAITPADGKLSAEDLAIINGED